MQTILDIAGILKEAFDLQDDSDVARIMSGSNIIFVCRWANLSFQVKRNRKDPPISVQDFLWDEPPDYSDLVHMHVRVEKRSPWYRIQGRNELVAWLSCVKHGMVSGKQWMGDYSHNLIEGNRDVEI